MAVSAARRPGGAWAWFAAVSGLGWIVEENFRASKGPAGLDEHQVRRWTAWYQWATLAMLASAFLTITAAAGHVRTPDPADQLPFAS